MLSLTMHDQDVGQVRLLHGNRVLKIEPLKTLDAYVIIVVHRVSLFRSQTFVRYPRMGHFSLRVEVP